MINVHASILPRYRGAAPVHRAVIDGETEIGITIMRVVSELDAGPMFSIARAPIPPDATSGDMEAVLAGLGARELLPIVDALAEGRAIETPQDHAAATHAPKVSKAEGAIDWHAPAAVVHNRVRGLQPWPLASTTLDGERLGEQGLDEQQDEHGADGVGHVFAPRRGWARAGGTAHGGGSWRGGRFHQSLALSTPRRSSWARRRLTTAKESADEHSTTTTAMA